MLVRGWKVHSSASRNRSSCWRRIARSCAASDDRCRLGAAPLLTRFASDGGSDGDSGAAGRRGVGRCGGWRARLGRLQADARRGRLERAALLVHQLLRAREIRIRVSFHRPVAFKRQ